MKLPFGLLFIALYLGKGWTSGKTAREVADFVVQKFGRESVKEGTAALARKLETLAAKHGAEVFEATRKVGPSAVHLVEDAGTHGAKAANLLARFGDEAISI